MNIALLASGKGSNVKNILSHFQENDDININLVATNNPNSPVIQYAKDFNVDSFFTSHNKYCNMSVATAMIFGRRFSHTV